MEVGLGPGDFLLDGDPCPPPKKGQSPQFLAHVDCGQTAGWIKMALGMEVGLGPGRCARWGLSSPPEKKGGGAPNFLRIFIVAKQLYISGYHLARM